MNARFTRFTFIMIAGLQLLRRQISFYDILILGDLSGLLAVPLMSIGYSRFRLGWLSVMEELANILVPLTHLAVNALLFNFIRQRDGLLCHRHGIDIVGEMNLTVHYPRICISIVMNAILLHKSVFSLLFPNHRDCLSSFELLYTAGCITVSLETLIWELDKVEFLEQRENGWGFGQLVAIIGLIVIVVQVWEYGKGESKVMVNVPRYVHWESESTKFHCNKSLTCG